MTDNIHYMDITYGHRMPCASMDLRMLMRDCPETYAEISKTTHYVRAAADMAHDGAWTDDDYDMLFTAGVCYGLGHAVNDIICAASAGIESMAVLAGRKVPDRYMRRMRHDCGTERNSVSVYALLGPWGRHEYERLFWAGCGHAAVYCG